MKANAQYNDFVGTSAADISDHSNLKDFLKSRNVDLERYNPIGASFYHGYSDFFTAYIVCVDNDRSTDDKPYIINMHFEVDFTPEEFFNLFKRFHVVVTNKYGGYQDHEIDEEITINDRNQ